MDTFAKVLLVITLLVFLVICGPLITIWALNNIFHLGIESTFANWLAILWLSGIVGGGTKYFNRK